MQSTAIVQGGFLAACQIDAATQAIHHSQADPLHSVTVMESKVTYLLPARIGVLLCVVVLRRVGGRVGFVEVLAYQQEKLLVTLSTTLILERKKPFAHTNATSLTSIPQLPHPRANTEEATALLSLSRMQKKSASKESKENFNLATFFNSHHHAFDLMSGTLWSEMVISNQAMDEEGYIQAGFVSAMVDNCMATAFMGFRRWQVMYAPTLELQTHYFHKIKGSCKAEFVTRIVHMDNQFGYLEVELFQNGILMAKGESTLLMTYSKM